MIVAKKCPVCGAYNKLSAIICKCGSTLEGIAGEELTGEVQENLNEVIDENVTYYIQICPVCNTKNYTDLPAHPIKKCRNCNRYNIEEIKPVQVEKQEHTSKIQMEKTDESVPSWDDILSEQLGNNILHIESIGVHSGFEEEFRKEDAPILLGRYAADILDERDERFEKYMRIEKFLQQDRRVGSYHCHFIYCGNKWYIQDGVWEIPEQGIQEKRSRNTTRVNGKKIMGRVEVKNNDIIKMGQDEDSIELKIKFRE